MSEPGDEAPLLASAAGGERADGVTQLGSPASVSRRGSLEAQASPRSPRSPRSAGGDESLTPERKRLHMPAMASELLQGVAAPFKGLAVVSFKGARAVRSVWMDTVHKYAHENFPNTSAFIDKHLEGAYDWTTYQFRSYFRVHLFHFLVSPLLGGLLIHLHNGIPFIDAWFSGCAAMTGGSLMPYDVSKLDRFGEFVLWGLMLIGGVTIMCIPPALNRMYIFRMQLRPALQEAINLSREVQELAREAGASGADQLDEDIQDFETMHEEYQLKDEVQELIAIITAVYTGVWHLFGGAAIYAAIAYQGVVPEYAARGIGDAWFSVFMICSCLNNVGLSLLDDSMMPLVDRPAPLMIMAFAMIFGNTAWPIAFRGILLLLHKAFPDARSVKHALDNPQQSSPSLFSGPQTWGLVGAVLVSNAFMVTMFMTCSAPLVRDGRSTSTLLYLAFFQCANARSSGLQTFDLKRISKNMLVIIGFFMWYAPTPLVGIIAGEEFNMVFHGNPILSGFIKKYTNRHTTWIVVVYIIISTAEQRLLEGADNWPPMATPRTTLFNILFEMMSAYGTNGLSMGFPGVDHSLSGMFRPVSKLSIMFLMILGRHRSMQGKSDETLMPSLRRITEHVERLKEQRLNLRAPAAAMGEARRSAQDLVVLEMSAMDAEQGRRAQPSVRGLASTKEEEQASLLGPHSEAPM